MKGINGCEKDDHKASAFLSKAIEQGDGNAMKYLFELEFSMKNKEMKEKKIKNRSTLDSLNRLIDQY